MRRKPIAPRNGTAPHYRSTPPPGSESVKVLAIAFNISPDFCAPKILPALGPAEHRAIMPVPEAAVDENDRTMLLQNNIGSTRKLLVMKPEAKPPSVKPAPDHHFRLRVTALDGSHVSAAGFAVVDVSQPGEPLADCPALLPLECEAS